LPDNVENSIKYFHDHKDQYLEQLNQYIRIPSISADTKFKAEIVKTANWLVSYLKSIGMEQATAYETNLSPIVYADYLKAGKTKPTVLIYGHYDVQPADPVEQWSSDPFEPVEKGGLLYARGASDNKGQLMAALAAIDSMMHARDFPLNLKFLVEGEEEIGSPSIIDFLQSHQELFECDFALNLDAGMIAEDFPTIVYGLRGLAYFEILVKGPGHDLHSGVFGGVVYNPAQALAEILSGMKNANGKILLPSFYEDVIPLEDEERKELARLPMDDSFFKNQTEVSELWGEKGYSSAERVGGRPTLEINGILSGYVGEGPKTVIPSNAMVKISMRLVPDQEPERVHQQLIQYMQQHSPKGISWEVKPLTSDFPCVISRDFYATRCFADALEKVFGKKPVYKREGGSIPIVSYMKKYLGIESVLSGFSLPDDRIHSPNERLNLGLWDKGVKTVIHFFDNLKDARS
jgi:acetylornithine deacetylase/succinyl-diaminopimelate desuccinylase-like protein